MLPGNQNYIPTLRIISPLVEQVKQHQKEDHELMTIKKGVVEGTIEEFLMQDDVLWCKNTSCVPSMLDLNRKLLKEAYNSALTTHLTMI